MEEWYVMADTGNNQFNSQEVIKYMEWVSETVNRVLKKNKVATAMWSQFTLRHF